MRRSGLHRGGRALSNGCLEKSRQARGSPGDHARSPFLVRIHPGAAYPRDRAVPLRETLTSSSPLAGILTFSQAPETTRRGTAQQQRVRSHALERREPSTILPNHPPHIAHIASAPNARADSRCSRAHAQAVAGGQLPGRCGLLDVFRARRRLKGGGHVQPRRAADAALKSRSRERVGPRRASRTVIWCPHRLGGGVGEMGVVWERCALCSGAGPKRSQDGFRMCTLDPNSKVHRTKVLSSCSSPKKIA